MIRGDETAGWAATTAAVIGLHLLLAGSLVPRPPAEAAAAGDPIFVDLLPPEAPAVHQTDEPLPQPQPVQAPAEPAPPTEPADPGPPSDQPTTLAAAGFTPPQMNLLPALDNPAALFAPPAGALRLAASERPDPRPARSQVQRAQRQAAPRQSRAAAQQASRAAASPAESAPKAASRDAAKGAPRSAGQPAATGRAAPSRQQIAGWQAEIRARISRHMARTRFSGGGGRGTVQVQIAITIRANGAAAARLASSTGDPRYDSALAGQAARMPRMPAPPVPQDYSFALPVTVQSR